MGASGRRLRSVLRALHVVFSIGWAGSVAGDAYLHAHPRGGKDAHQMPICSRQFHGFLAWLAGSVAGDAHRQRPMADDRRLRYAVRRTHGVTRTDGLFSK